MKKANALLTLTLAGVAAGWFGLSVGAQEPAPAAAPAALTLVDIDGSKVALSLDDVRKMPQVTEENCIWVGEEAGYMGVFDYGGVRLTELLKKAKAMQDAKGYKKENLYLVFKGSDGYQVIASLSEITGTPDGERALVAIQKDDKPLPAPEGVFRVVFPADKYVGRSVKFLDTIEIKCAEGFVDKKKPDTDAKH